MAARSRGDRGRAEQLFREVWQQGKPGDILSTAAHLFGVMVRDQEIAERALRDSLEWCGTDHDQGQVWHSLGNLLSRQSPRWKEAEEAYHKALQLLPTPDDQGQVYASLAGAIIKRQDSPSYAQAEEYLHYSLSLRPRVPRHRSTVYGLLARLYETSGRHHEAIEALGAAIEADREVRNWPLLRDRQARIEKLCRKLPDARHD